MRRFWIWNCRFSVLTQTLRSWKVFYRRLSLAGIMLIALCAFSCKTSREVTLQRDSLFVTERLKAGAIIIPSSQTEIRAALADVIMLPAGAKFTARNGLNSVELFYVPDTIGVISRCDSLESAIWEYEKEIRELKDSKKEKEITVNAPRDWFSLKWFAIGALGGMVLAVMIYVIFKIKNWL